MVVSTNVLLVEALRYLVTLLALLTLGVVTELVVETNLLQNEVELWIVTITFSMPTRVIFEVVAGVFIAVTHVF